MLDKEIGIYSTIATFALYIIGGIGIFSGLTFIVFLNGRDLFGLGDARPMGYLLLCIGGCLSIAGVLMLRMARNRVDRLLVERAMRAKTQRV